MTTFLDQTVTCSEAASCLLFPMKQMERKENENGQWDASYDFLILARQNSYEETGSVTSLKRAVN